MICPMHMHANDSTLNYMHFAIPSLQEVLRLPASQCGFGRSRSRLVGCPRLPQAAEDQNRGHQLQNKRTAVA